MDPKREDGTIEIHKDGKVHRASRGSLVALKKHNYDIGKAVKAGDFDWASEPYAAAQDALQVAKASGLVKEGSLRITKKQLRSLIFEALNEAPEHDYAMKHQMLKAAYGKLLEAIDIMNEVFDYEVKTGDTFYADQHLAPIIEKLESCADNIGDEASAVFEMVQMQ